MRNLLWLAGGLFPALFVAAECRSADPLFNPKKGDKVVLIGNTLAERMQYFNHFETLLQQQASDKELVVRNLGWSGDTINLRLRSKDFPDHGHTLLHHQPDTILTFFGFNESFAGPDGVEQFEADLAKFLADLKAMKYPVSTIERGSTEAYQQDGPGEASKTPNIILVSPIANENLSDRNIAAADWNNANLELYTKAMQKVAAANGVGFVDLFTPTKSLLAQDDDLTINGCHLSDEGYARLASILLQALTGEQFDAKANPALHAAIAEKNLQHFYDYRAVNGYYIYGGRKAPFGVVNFPAEFEKLRKMVALRDRRVWDIAEGKSVSETIDDSSTGDFAVIETNFKNEVYITPPEEALKAFTVPEGFEISLWASEKDYPELENPVQFAFDAKGRMFVTTIGSYPMYLPGTPVNDKVLIFEDADGDGKADQPKVFADGLYIPIGIELGDGGAYVSQQPNVVFLKDTDGDDRADVKRTVLHGFDSADSHHAISAFEWGPGGDLYFQEGTFHHSQIESPYGLKRSHNAAVFRYEPRSEKFDIYVEYNFANPWGHCWDDWGQDFVADASGGANYFAAAFSGQLDYPRQHPGLKEFLVKQWRPTCGCEIVSSRHFPDEMQGDYLLNNCIGFQGTLQYRFKEAGSGFHADPVEPLVRSSDPNFRPTDLMFGPDGALYILDWFNPLVGHMQHSIRDPNRDKKHGRIWRVTYKNKPLLTPPKISGATLAELFELLKAYEIRTRYNARLELRDRPTAEVISQLDAWVAKLDKSDERYEHHLLEALWVKQHHGAVDAAFLDRLLNAEDPRARAAATRVLCYWRDDVDNPLALLQARVNDEHPRVRLEAVRALSFFGNQQAYDIAVESLLYEQDDYLDYTLKETLDTLEKRITK
ncbi:MAG: GDSL-type esterase/lipase family protein [Planctomycetaceae bacterium]